jgi:hypothetical protein
MSPPPSTEQLVIELLLKSTPAALLEELGLSRENQSSWEQFLRGKTPEAKHVFVDLFSQALFHASKSASSYRKCRSIISQLDVPPDVIFALVQIAQLDEQERTEDLIAQVRAREASRKASLAVKARHQKQGSDHQKAERARLEIRATWASGKYKDRDTCAEQECGYLNISYSTARKALRGTPDPEDWPAMKGNKAAKRA